MHAAAELGPLPRYKTRAAYEQHIATATLGHMAGFRHPWRLHDIMNARHLERIWQVVARAGEPQAVPERVRGRVAALEVGDDAHNDRVWVVVGPSEESIRSCADDAERE